MVVAISAMVGVAATGVRAAAGACAAVAVTAGEAHVALPWTCPACHGSTQRSVHLGIY